MPGFKAGQLTYFNSLLSAAIPYSLKSMFLTKMDWRVFSPAKDQPSLKMGRRAIITHFQTPVHNFCGSSERNQWELIVSSWAAAGQKVSTWLRHSADSRHLLWHFCISITVTWKYVMWAEYKSQIFGGKLPWKKMRSQLTQIAVYDNIDSPWSFITASHSGMIVLVEVLLATSHAACSLFDWKGLFWAGGIINLALTNNSFKPLNSESPASLLLSAFSLSFLGWW